MHTKLLRDLDEQIRNSTDRVQWARIVCRKASYFARQGETAAALHAIEKVRAEFGCSPEPEVACWLMLTEGISQFFVDNFAEAHDRFRGAYGLAKAFDIKRARPSCAAWMAYFEFSHSNFDSMIKLLAEALTGAAADDYPARGRACLVLADAFHHAGSFVKARPWYERTRLHASSEEDRSMLAALFHNVAAIRIANVRLAEACGESNAIEVNRASMELYSAHNYNQGVGATSLSHSIPLLQAQMLSIEGRHYEALVILTETDTARLPARSHCIIEINKAWCSLSLGMAAHAKTFGQLAVDKFTEDIEPDDLAYVLARLVQIEKAIGEVILEGCGERAAAAVSRHRDAQASLERKLDKLVAGLST